MKKNWVETKFIDSSRLDTDYYSPEALEVLETLKNNEFCPSKKLKNLCSAIFSFGAYEQCNLLEFIPFQESAIPFITVSDIESPFINQTSLKYIPFRIHTVLTKSQCQPMDVLLSMAGTIGSVAIVPSYFLKCNSNQALAKLRFKKNGLDPYYAF